MVFMGLDSFGVVCESGVDATPAGGAATMLR
jgi:hypothetical protein